jgi:hypothetical protein
MVYRFQNELDQPKLMATSLVREKKRWVGAMGKLFYYSILACLALGFGACREQPPTEQHAEAKSDVVPHAARVVDAPAMAPDQIVRVAPEVVRKKSTAGEVLLVCAYKSDVAFRAAKLQGAISYQQFIAAVPSLDLKQEIIFYCA